VIGEPFKPETLSFEETEAVILKSLGSL